MYVISSRHNRFDSRHLPSLAAPDSKSTLDCYSLRFRTPSFIVPSHRSPYQPSTSRSQSTPSCSIKLCQAYNTLTSNAISLKEIRQYLQIAESRSHATIDYAGYTASSGGSLIDKTSPGHLPTLADIVRQLLIGRADVSHLDDTIFLFISRGS